MMILWCLLGVAILAAGGVTIWFCCSPMPVVRMLRKGGDAPSGWPEDEPDAAIQVNVEKDLVYPSEYGRNLYDLYLPKELAGPVPVVVWAHGGAFVAGNRSGVENWAVCLAHHGYAVAAVEYQWAPEAHWPAQVNQLCECCNRLKDDPRLDMSRVIIAGDSAGAHMAAQFALIHTSKTFRQETGLVPVLSAGALKAVLLYCGPYDIDQMANPKSRFLRLAMHRVGWSYLGRRRWRNTKPARAATIRSFVTKDFPPAYITDGNTGSFEAQGKSLAQLLTGLGVEVSTLFFKSTEGEVTHEYQFRMDTPEGRRCYADTLAFLAKHVGKGGQL